MEKIFAIALNTYRESVRSKILYSIMFFAAILVVISALFGTVTIGDQIKVIKNFGLFSISLFTVAFAVISGAALLFKELSKKTVYNILAKSVHRWQFILGKYLGMLWTTAVMILLMGAGFLIFLYFFENKLDFLVVQALFYIFLELIIVCAAAMFFSSIVVTPMLSGLFTFAIFIAGRSTEYLLYFVKHGMIKGALASILEFSYMVLPHLNSLYVADAAVHGHTDALGIERLLWSLSYSIGYAGILLVLATINFRRREFN